MLKVNIDGKEIHAQSGQTILEVCQQNNIPIPTLCHDRQLKPQGSCWLCVVEIK